MAAFMSEARPTVPADSGCRVLFVDLDGTLIASDILWEGFFRVLRKEPWLAFSVPVWVLQGAAAIKHRISERDTLDASGLPYREEVLEYVRQRKAEGCRIVLATASHHRWALGVASHLDLFDDIIASDVDKNLKGPHKLAAIEAYCRAHGFTDWGYIGDSPADLPIWERAAEVHVVAPSGGLLARIEKSKRSPAKVFGRRRGIWLPMVKALRPHQWVKNVLLFVPLLLAREFTQFESAFAALLAFASFSLCASSVYIFNDLLDIEADRLHHRKRKRPFAAGTLPLMLGPPLAAGLLALAFGLALVFLDPAYVVVLVLYLVTTSAYSTVLKSRLLVDVFVLAGLYTLRIFAGGVATGLPVSEWLLAFSIFFFTSLAFAKRYVELARLLEQGKKEARGRGYEVGDMSMVETFGATSGYLAVLVFALYVNHGLPAFYTNKTLMWLSCPVLMFWITRLWFLAKRGQLDDDPVVFAVTDRTSLVIGAVVGALVLLAAPL